MAHSPHPDTAANHSHIRNRGHHVGPCPSHSVSLPGHAPILSPSFRLAQAIYEPNVSRENIPAFSTPIILHTYRPMKMEQTECSETLAYKIETPRNYPEESIHLSEHGESLKSRNKPLFRVYIFN
jgi:hypothetical protein